MRKSLTSGTLATEYSKSAPKASLSAVDHKAVNQSEDSQSRGSKISSDEFQIKLSAVRAARKLRPQAATEAGWINHLKQVLGIK